MGRRKEVVFVASENGALRGGKVGGVADVVRDLPVALARERCLVRIVTPSYGALHELPGARKLGDVPVPFGGAATTATAWSVPGTDAGVENIVIDHERISAAGKGVIYVGDDGDRPFASDAARFAFFCAAVASWLLQGDRLPDVLHLHDWHAGLLAALREYDLRCERLRSVRTAFTVHNLSYQGTRPLRGDESSLNAWYPDLPYDDRILDPRYEDCVNPMATAIRLADVVSTVSPTYAEEICRPSDPTAAFIGGEGLEHDLRQIAAAGRLFGILNGCYYDSPQDTPDWDRLIDDMRAQVDAWLSDDPGSEAHRLAHERLATLDKRPDTLLVSIGRLVSQKATLMVTPIADTATTLEEIARQSPDALTVILGSGEARFESAVLDAARRCDNLVFLNGYSETIADPLYGTADLFLMPSSFEPCGISQMLSMRAGVPCVVHGVGGLADTVEDGFNGFVFRGNDTDEQASGFVAAVQRALHLRANHPRAWRAMQKAAADSRFEWRDAARQTIAMLYGEHRA